MAPARMIAVAVALLGTPLWLGSVGSALVGRATFGQCTGVQSGSTDVTNGGKCINTDANGAAIYPYTGYLYLPAGTHSIVDIYTFHTPGASCFTPVSATYHLNLTSASSTSHDYTYIIPQGTVCGYPTPPVGTPIISLGFAPTGDVMSYTLSVAPDTTTYPDNINTSRNQAY